MSNFNSLERQNQSRSNAIRATLETGRNMVGGAFGLYAVGMLATHGFHINFHEFWPETVSAFHSILHSVKDLGTDAINNSVPFLGGLAVGFIQSLILDKFTGKRLSHLLQQGNGTLVVNDQTKSTERSVMKIRCGDPRGVEKDGVKKAGALTLLGALPLHILIALETASHFDGPAAAFIEGHALGSNVLTAIKEHKGVMETVDKGIRFSNSHKPGQLAEEEGQGHGLKCGALAKTNPITYALKFFSDHPLTYLLADAIAIPYEVMAFITANLYYSPRVAIKNKGQATLTYVVGHSKIDRHASH